MIYISKVSFLVSFVVWRRAIVLMLIRYDPGQIAVSPKDFIFKHNGEKQFYLLLRMLQIYSRIQINSLRIWWSSVSLYWWSMVICIFRILLGWHFFSYIGMWSKQLDHSFCWLTNKRFISILLQNFKNYTATVWNVACLEYTSHRLYFPKYQNKSCLRRQQ